MARLQLVDCAELSTRKQARKTERLLEPDDSVLRAKRHAACGKTEYHEAGREYHQPHVVEGRSPCDLEYHVGEQDRLDDEVVPRIVAPVTAVVLLIECHQFLMVETTGT